VMTGLVIIGLVLRPQGRMLRRVSWIGVGLAAVYLLNTAVAYLVPD
jgi:cation:H+ antiporter